MPNSILPQDQDGQVLFNAISSFFCKFEIGNLLRKCNAQKEKGVPVLTEGKRSSGTGYLQVQAVQCLLRPQYVYAAEDRFLQGIFFKEYLLPLSEQPED